MTPAATSTVVGVFRTQESARKAITELEQSGFSMDAISMVVRSENESEGSTVAGDAAIGAAAGGLGGILLSFAAFTVPGIGPVVAAGPLLAALGGAGVGAIAGGLIGGLTEVGVPEEEAHYFAEGVRRGEAVVAVQTIQAEAERAREILDRNGTVNVQQRVTSWRSRGWIGHNPGVEPLSADEIRREREFYDAFEKQAYEWEHMTDKERKHAGSSESGTKWPHKEAHDIGNSLVEAEAENAAEDSERTSRNAEHQMGTKKQNLEKDVETYHNSGADVAEKNRGLKNSNPEFGASIENNRRVTDPATKKIENAQHDAMESAVKSAKGGARVYERKGK